MNILIGYIFGVTIGTVVGSTIVYCVNKVMNKR